MKDDTISRAAALSVLNGLTEIYLNNLPPTIDRADAVDAIKALPPAQPEIMRCKDCRYNNDCEIQYSAQSGDEFFCGYAEGKDNE